MDGIAWTASLELSTASGVRSPSLCVSLSVRNRLRKYSWRCCGLWWNCWQIVQLGTDCDEPAQLWRMVMFLDRFSVHNGLKEYSWHCPCVVKISAKRPNAGGLWQPITTVTDGDVSLPKIYLAVLWWKCRQIVLIGTDWDNLSQPWRIVIVHEHLSVCNGLRKYSWQFYGVWWKFGKSSWLRRIVMTRHSSDGLFMAVLLTLANSPNWDGSWRPVRTVMDSYILWPFVSLWLRWCYWGGVKLSVNRPNWDG